MYTHRKYTISADSAEQKTGPDNLGPYDTGLVISPQRYLVCKTETEMYSKGLLEGTNKPTTW